MRRLAQRAAQQAPRAPAQEGHRNAARPRLQIFRSLHHTYAFVVDDAKGHTLVAASTREGAVADGLGSHTNIEAAEKVGSTIAERAKAAGIDAVVFDTSGHKYHGRVAALGASGP